MRWFYIIMFLIAVWVGYICSLTSNTIDAVNKEYQKEESKIDRLIDIFQDWKEKDTAKIH